MGRGGKKKNPNKAEWCWWSDNDEGTVEIVLDVVQHSALTQVLSEFKNQNTHQESADTVKYLWKIYRKSWWSALVKFSSPDVLMEHSFSAKFPCKKKKKKVLLEKQRSKNPIPETRTLSRGHSRRLLSHRSGTEQKFHTNYTGQAKPRCFCNCLSSPAQKRKEKNLGLDDDDEDEDRQQKEKAFGLLATRTKGGGDVFTSHGHGHW